MMRLGLGLGLTRGGVNPLLRYAANGFSPDMAFVPRDNFYWTSAAQTTFDGITGGTFLRSTTATFTAAGGLLDTAAIDEARVDHHLFDGTSFVRAGMLDEDDDIQYVRFASDIAANWLTTSNAVSLSEIDNNFTRITTDGTNSFPRADITGLTAGSGTFTAAIEVREGTSGVAVLRLTGTGLGGAGTQTTYEYDFSSGLFALKAGAAALDGPFVEEVDDGVFLFWFTQTSTTITAISVRPVFDDNTSGLTLDFRRPQLTESRVPSSFIPNPTGSTVARGADDLRIPAAVMAKAMADAAASAELADVGAQVGSNATIVANGDGFDLTATGNFMGLAQPGVMVVGRKYLVTVGWSDNDSPTRNLFINGVGAIDGIPVASVSGSVTFVAEATSTELLVFFNGSVAGEEKFVRIKSVREVTMPAAISIAVKGRMTYADEGSAAQLVSVNWESDSNNFIRNRINTVPGTGRYDTLQKSTGTTDLVSSGSSVYSPGNNVPFSIASRHGATFINGAHEGTLLTANLTPTSLADLVTADFEIATGGNFIIEEVLIWFLDIGDDGITEASQL